MIYRLLLSIIIMFSFTSCQSQGPKKETFPYRNTPNSIKQNADINVDYSDYIDITKYLPKNFVKNGSVDYTQYIQQGISDNRNVLMPNFPILINEKGLNIPSNTNIFFLKKSKLILEPNANTHYNVIGIINKQNVNIYNPRIVGDRFNHKSDKGEWGMGISILSSSNISIYNPEILNCWGDAIEIGSTGTNSCKNIIIKGGWLDYSRRNGLSVLDVDGLLIENLTISNTNGIPPSAGLILEPFRNTQELKNIKLKNIKTFNNHTGFSIQYYEMFAETDKHVDIVLDGFEDQYSFQDPIYMGIWRDKVNKQYKKIKGSVNIKNVLISNGKNNHFILLDRVGTDLPNMNIENYKVNNLKNKGVILQNDKKSQVSKASLKLN